MIEIGVRQLDLNSLPATDYRVYGVESYARLCRRLTMYRNTLTAWTVTARR